MSATVSFDMRGPSLVASMGFRCEEFTRLRYLKRVTGRIRDDNDFSLSIR